jgi:diguanylate cyclase (GGDEF)-like protein
LSTRDLLPVVLLAFSLFTTYKAWNSATRIVERSLQAEFQFRVQELDDFILQRMHVYEQVLRGARGLFAASHEVTRQEFSAYVKSLDLQREFPGIQGVGYSAVVPAPQKDKHIREVRSEGFPSYDIFPPGPRVFYTAIMYLEPFAGRNLRAFGYDMFSEPVRRAAMEVARDTGNVSVSGKTRLVQETGKDVQSGFLMYMPVYRSGGAHGTLAERRADLAGWVYAPFRMNDLMQHVQGGRTEDMSLEIYDGDMIAPDALMYDSNPNHSAISPRRKLKTVEHLTVGAHHWTVAMAALPAFEQRVDFGRPTLILRSGVSISLLLSLLMWLFLDDRARAIQAADQAIQLALYDPLTGLPNRKLLTERLGQAIAQAKRDHHKLAVFFIDLDKFKPVNDRFGHAVGDLLLREVALRLQGCMRESDTAARLGGDEFVALLAHIGDRHSAEVAAEKILYAFRQPFDIAGHRLDIGASIGIAMYPDDGQDQQALIKSADFAMYEAKSAGTGEVRFAADMS